MKLLLTSAGLENESIKKALRELIGKEYSQTTAVFIITAANVEEGGKNWLIKDLHTFKELGFQELEIADIAHPQELWKTRLEKADILIFGGGNTTYLMKQLRTSELATKLPSLLQTKVYVGISAGSMVAAPALKEKKLQHIYHEEKLYDENDEALRLVDFLVIPHLNSPHFPRSAELIEIAAKNIPDIPLYALDDNSAVQVIDDQVTVISEGKWKRYN